MKVAIIAPTSIPSRRANTIQVMKMAQAITAIGHQVHLLIPEGQQNNSGSTQTWEYISRHYGLKTEFDLHWIRSTPVLRKYDFALRAVRMAEKMDADLIYTRLPQAAALASFLGYPCIFEIHDFPQGVMAPIWLRVYLSGNGAKRLISISDALTNDLSTTFRSSNLSRLIKVFPDGVDLQWYEDLPSPARAREQIVNELGAVNSNTSSHFFTDRFTVGYTGHLYPGRGTSIMMEMAVRTPQVNFLIVGGEPGAVQKFQQAVQERKLENVTLTGFIPNQKLPIYQAACDVLLMPYQRHVSASSGGDIGRYLSPMKLFEYLASGRAICSSDLPVLQEILSPENALLLPPDDVEAWVKAVRRLIEDPAFRDRLAGQARETATKYSWQARAEMILSDLSGIN